MNLKDIKEIQEIQEALLRNQKIIRYASDSISLEGNFDDETKNLYLEDKKKTMELRENYKGFVLNFSNLKDETNKAELSIGKEIKASVTIKDTVKELNSELTITGNYINCTTKKFLVDTDNLKITENSLTFNGEVHGLSCIIGGFSIEGDKMTGNTSSTISSGTINADTLYLYNAIADYIDLNPDNIEGKKVTFTSSKNQDKDYKEYTDTNVTGDLHLSGNMDATYGWDDDEHGTPYSVAYDHYEVTGAVLLQDYKGYKSKNRLRCDHVYSESEGDTWSDERLKRNIKALNGSTAERFLMALSPVSYRMKERTEESIGYIAQDMLVAEKETGIKGIVKTDGKYYGIAYGELQALRIAVIQRNQKRIERLRNESKG